MSVESARLARADRLLARPLQGYNEALILYVLGPGSPTHRLPRTSEKSGEPRRSDSPRMRA
jgi:hypothetical protein